MVRNCPRCQTEVVHETEYDYKAALRSSRPCEGCLDMFCVEEGKPVGSLTRRCPRCERKIFYGGFQAKRQADRAAKLCKLCADDDTRSKCRDDKWRAVHAESLKKVWADPGSIFRTDEYRKKLSEIQSAMPSEVFIKRGEGNKRRWASYTEEERVARVMKFISCARSPEAIAKQSASMKAWWATIPADHPYRNWTDEQRTNMSRILKENPETLELMQKAIEKSHRSGCASALESQMAKVLIPRGFKQTQRVPGTRFYVDFLNEETKQAVELYGDFWHCHPRFEESWNLKYGGINPTTKDVPSERRAKDAERVKQIEQQGYAVEVVWQSELRVWLKSFGSL